MAIEFDVTENKQDTRPDKTPIPDTRLVRVSFRPLPNSPIHSNVFHMQLPATGTRLLIDSRGRAVTESGKLVEPDEIGDFPEPNPADPFRREAFTRNVDAEMARNIEAYWERKLRAVEEGKPYPQHHNSTLNLQVAAAADDYYHYTHSSGDFFAGSSTFFQGGAGGVITFQPAARFTDVLIGQGNAIDAATLVLTAKKTESNTTVLTNIVAEDVDDADPIDNDTERDAMVFTTGAASIAWDSIGGWTADVENSATTSPEIKAVIQAIVDRGGWASGNALIISWNDDGSTANAQRTAHSYDSNTALAPKLDIDFTGGGGAPATRRYNLPTLGVG